ncbi:hypothetical protein AAKU64_003932 [Undibacterium sp. GrIS 1.8]
MLVCALPNPGDVIKKRGKLAELNQSEWAIASDANGTFAHPNLNLRVWTILLVSFFWQRIKQPKT